MADIATLQARLAEAETAYHQLAIGSSEAEVQHADRRVRYTAANRGDLMAYIQELRALLAAAGSPDSRPRRRGLIVDL